MSKELISQQEIENEYAKCIFSDPYKIFEQGAVFAESKLKPIIEGLQEDIEFGKTLVKNREEIINDLSKQLETKELEMIEFGQYCTDTIYSSSAQTVAQKLIQFRNREETKKDKQ